MLSILSNICTIRNRLKVIFRSCIFSPQLRYVAAVPRKNYKFQNRLLRQGIVKGSMVKTATSQNGDTETAIEVAIVKTATNANNTYSSSDVYIGLIVRRLYTVYTCMACNC